MDIAFLWDSIEATKIMHLMYLLYTEIKLSQSASVESKKCCYSAVARQGIFPCIHPQYLPVHSPCPYHVFLEKFLPKPSHQASDSARKIGFLGQFCKMRIRSEFGSLGREMYIMSKRGTIQSQWLRSKVPYSISREAHTQKDKRHPSGQSFWRMQLQFTKLECPECPELTPDESSHRFSKAESSRCAFIMSV